MNKSTLFIFIFMMILSSCIKNTFNKPSLEGIYFINSSLKGYSDYYLIIKNNRFMYFSKHMITTCVEGEWNLSTENKVNFQDLHTCPIYPDSLDNIYIFQTEEKEQKITIKNNIVNCTNLLEIVINNSDTLRMFDIKKDTTFSYSKNKIITMKVINYNEDEILINDDESKSFIITCFPDAPLFIQSKILFDELIIENNNLKVIIKGENFLLHKITESKFQEEVIKDAYLKNNWYLDN